LINWVWYSNYAEGSREFKELMTDKDSKIHYFTLPIDGVRDEIWTQQKEYSERVLPPQFAELVNKTPHPFVQAITDVISQMSFFDGRFILVGDALCGFRPHTAASTSQAAFHAQLLGRVCEAKMGLADWEKQAMKYAKHISKHGIDLGQRSQFGHHLTAQS
jgi:hypothetical protein